MLWNTSKNFKFKFIWVLPTAFYRISRIFRICGRLFFSNFHFQSNQNWYFTKFKEFVEDDFFSFSKRLVFYKFCRFYRIPFGKTQMWVWFESGICRLLDSVSKIMKYVHISAYAILLFVLVQFTGPGGIFLLSDIKSKITCLPSNFPWTSIKSHRNLSLSMDY